MKKINKFLFAALLAFVALATTALPLVALAIGILSIVASTFTQTFGCLTMGLSADEEELLKKIEEKLKSELFKVRSGVITTEQFEERMTKIQTTLDGANSAYAKDFSDKIENFRESFTENLKKIDEKLVEIAKQKENAPAGDNIREILERDEVKKFFKNPNGRTEPLELRVNITSNYVGDNLITKKINNLTSEPLRKSHVRDLIANVPSDMPTIYAPKVTSYTDNGGVVAENGTVTGSTFTITEGKWDVKRLTAFIDDISQRMLKSLTYVENYIRTVLTNRLLFVEDGQIIWGDNAGNNLDGIMKNFSTMTLTGPTFVATSFASVATWNTAARTIVTFAAPHELKSGYKITISNATHAGYNDTFDADVLDAYRIVINHAYTAEGAPQMAAWTAVSAHPYKDAIAAANELDCLNTAISLCYTGEFAPTGGIIHPMMGTKILSLLKTAVEFDYLKTDVMRRGGFLWVNGVPFTETTACPANRCFIGDFSAQNIMLNPFGNMSIVFAADVANIKANTVSAIIQEETSLSVLNPYVLWTFDFTTFKAELQV